MDGLEHGLISPGLVALAIARAEYRGNAISRRARRNTSDGRLERTAGRNERGEERERREGQKRQRETERDRETERERGGEGGREADERYVEDVHHRVRIYLLNGTSFNGTQLPS
jgi:hypothetical protein